MVIMVLPVNSSAPAMTTSIRPTEKTAPLMKAASPTPTKAAASWPIMFEISPPKAM